MADIITLEEYKTYASINSPNQDARITSFIAAVTAAIRAYLGYEFTDDTTVFTNPKKTATFLIHPMQQEYLLDETDVYVSYVQWQRANPYIGQGSSIVEINDQYMELLDNEWFADTNLGKITFFRPVTDNFIAVIEYKTSKTPSEDIKLAALMLLDYWRDKKNFEASITQQGQSVNRAPTGNRAPIGNLPRHIESLLSPHRKL